MSQAETARRMASAAVRDEELRALYRSWRILDLVGETAATLPPTWLEILNLARNLLEGNPLPGVDVPDDLLNLVGPAEKEIVTTVRTEHRRRVVISPTDDTTLQPLRHLNDYHLITLPDLMLRDVDPELFEFGLVSGTINGQYPVATAPSVEEWDEIVEERVRTTRPVRKKRQKVYALLDVSNSMREDNRAIFAKALMLAYLLSAAAEGSKVYFRTFANTVHERTDSAAAAGFPALARRLLQVTPDGGTDIKRALDIAITDIRRIDEVNTFEKLFQAPPTEIFLISDCESYSIPYIPPGIKLHTVHLKGGRMMTAYEEGFAKIKAESTSFHEIDTSRLLLPDTTRERWLLLQDGRLRDEGEAQAIGLEPEATAPIQPSDVVQVYEKLDEGRPTGSVRRHGTPQPAGLSLPFTALWRAFKSGANHVVHPRASRAGHKAQPVHSHAAMHFRVRR